MLMFPAWFYYLILFFPFTACEGYILLTIYLHFFYSMALQDLLKMVSSGKEGYGDSWCDMREKLLQIYSAALASNCGHLVEVIQVMLVCTYKGLFGTIFVSNHFCFEFMLIVLQFNFL